MRTSYISNDQFEEMLDAVPLGDPIQLNKFRQSAILLNETQKMVAHDVFMQKSERSTEDPYSLLLRGFLLEFGLKVSKNIEKAVSFYSRAAQSKNGMAFGIIANNIRAGHYCPTLQLFKTTGVMDPGGNFSEQAAAFLHHGIRLNDALSYVTLALMIENDCYKPTAEDFKELNGQNPGSDRYQEAAAYYRVAISLKHPTAVNNLGGLIKRGLYIPITADFEAAKIQNPPPPGSNQYRYAAAFFRRAMILNNKYAFFNLARMLHRGEYLPSLVDFEAAKISNSMVGADRHGQAAAFFRRAIALNHSASLSGLASMIMQKLYSPIAADFLVSNIQCSTLNSNKYQQALPFLLRYYAFPNTNQKIREEIVGKLKRIVKDKLDLSGNYCFALCRIYLLDKKDPKIASEYLNDHPNPKQVITYLLKEVIDHLDSQGGDIEKVQTLLDFCVNHDAKAVMPLMMHYTRLKMLLYQNSDAKALVHYQKNIPSYYSLTASEYYRLGSVIYTQHLPAKKSKGRKKRFNKLLEFFYQAYCVAKKSNQKILQEQMEILIVKILLDDKRKKAKLKGSVCFDVRYSQDNPLFDAFFKTECFLEKYSKIRSQKNRRIKMQKFCLEGFQYAREEALESKVDLRLFGLQKNKALELVFIERLISDLCLGQALQEKMKDKAFITKLNQYPLLKGLIVDKKQFPITLETTHFIGFLHARESTLHGMWPTWQIRKLNSELVLIRRLIHGISQGESLSKKVSDENFIQQLALFPLLKKLIFEKILTNIHHNKSASSCQPSLRFGTST